MDHGCLGDYQTFSIDDSFRVKVENGPHRPFLSSTDKEEIELLWVAEKSRKGEKLYNGQMLCFLRRDKNHIYGHFTEYKNYIAALRSPALRNKLPIDTLGASGITIADGHVLWGKRGYFVTEFPGYYECAPSGGLDPGMVVDGEIPIGMPFEKELNEETGITGEFVKEITPTTVVYDARAHLYEIVAVIELEDVVLNKKLRPSDEYEELIWVKMTEMSAFFEKHRGKILPLSHYLLTTGILSS